MLEKITSFSPKFLDTNNLVENKKYSDVIAYVDSNKAGFTKADKGFFTFYIKDVNGNKIPAQVFDVKEFLESGSSANGLLHRCVLITGYAQWFAGSWSFIIDKISSFSGLEAEEAGIKIDMADFKGKVEVDDCTRLETAFERYCSEALPVKFKTEGFSPICDGRVGGYLAIMTAVIDSFDYYRNMPDVSVDEMEETLVIASKAHLAYLSLMERDPNAQISLITDILHSIKSIHGKSKMIEHALDTAQALMGLGNPRHLYAHLIYNEIETRLNQFNLIYRNSMIPISMSASLPYNSFGTGGKILKRY